MDKKWLFVKWGHQIFIKNITKISYPFGVGKTLPHFFIIRRHKKFFRAPKISAPANLPDDLEMYILYFNSFPFRSFP
jgi:hypothetical protein